MSNFLSEQYYRILEVGCGEGRFETNFSGAFEYWGVEPNRDAAQIASKILHKVAVGAYEEVHERLPDNYFDLVVCNDVIEHMVDHEFFLRAIKQKMSNNACMVGSIPNVRYFPNLLELLVQKDWEYKERGILDSTHLRFFTEKSIRRMFDDYGFEIDDMHGINPVCFKMNSFKGALKKMMLPIFGSDTRFVQFGFRVRCR